MTIVISGRNVNDLYQQAIDLILRDGEHNDSRAGAVLSLPHPVVSVTTKPRERVLFDSTRDANPFFHLFESLWMLDGQNDGKWLDFFVSDFSSRFGERGGQIHGAYGWRWRSYFGSDQLDTVVDRLRKNHDDRRVVIQMWDADADLQTLEETPLKDVPCNTNIYPRIVDGKLDISVMVRSNDIVWGAYGANAVHLTVLQEYLAARIGVPVGTFYQFSNNWHAYTAVLDKMSPTDYRNPYMTHDVAPLPMVSTPSMWDEELKHFLADPIGFVPIHNLWLLTVAHRAWLSYVAFKDKEFKRAIFFAEGVAAPDWRLAMLSWLHRKEVAYNTKHGITSDV